MTSPGVSLALLIERLHWPVRRVRWEAARQLAGLVRAGDQTAKDMLIAWAAGQRLEYDALILPSFVYAFELWDHFTADQLLAAIGAPSLLSDALVAQMYPDAADKLHGFRYDFSDPDLDLPESEPLFEAGLGTIVPQIFDTMLTGEGRRLGVPLRRQWRREWQALQREKKEAYARRPDYFVAGDRGVVGIFELRQYAVYTSAFLRTISYAWAECGLRQRTGIHICGLVLPFNRGLSDFDASDRPAWSQDFLARFEASRPEAFAREVWRAAAATIEPGFEPLAIDMVDHGEQLAVRVEIQRALEDQADKPTGVALDDPLWVTPDSDWWTLGGQIPLAEPRDHQKGLRPLCVAVQPEAMARAQIDLLLGHILVADPMLANGPATLTCERDRIVVTDADGTLSTLHLWYADWTPTHPEAFKLMGSLTSCRSAALRAFTRDCGVAIPRLVRITTARRQYRYDAFQVETRIFRI